MDSATTTYICRDCGFSYGSRIPAPVQVYGHRVMYHSDNPPAVIVEIPTGGHCND